MTDLRNEILNMTESEKDMLWFCTIPGIYIRNRQLLMEQFADITRLKMASEREIQALEFLEEKQKYSILHWQKKNMDEFLHILIKSENRFVSIENEEYPCLLRDIPDAPFGLFVKGKLPVVGKRCIAIVGARMCTNYGRKMAEEIAGALTDKGIEIISGMADGIDGVAQASCLAHKGNSYGVLGCGVDICYPRSHIELYRNLSLHGGIISEYPPGTPSLPLHFPLRNRIISGMSEAVIVIEARKKSGSLITADQALEQGRDVYAVPGRIGDPLSEGCNHLIAQGAGAVENIGALLENLGLSCRIHKNTEKLNNIIATRENMVYICLDSHGKSLEEIADITKFPVNELMAALTSLEMKGLIHEISKNHYAVT